MSAVIGQRYLFDYPKHFETLPEYTAQAGKTVTVLSEAEDGVDYDREDGEQMFHIKTDDDWTGLAWDSELEEILAVVEEAAEDYSNIWFALGNDGQMYCLCDCGDMEAAEESATDLGVEAVWIADEKTARQWYERLRDNLPE